MLTTTDDHYVARAKEHRALSDVLWFANRTEPLDVESVVRRLKVLPTRTPYSLGSGVRALPDRRSSLLSEQVRGDTRRLHAWLRTFLRRHVGTRASRTGKRKKLVADQLRSVWLANGNMKLTLKGSDVFARVAFDGRRWLIVGEQFFIPTLEGLIHYASSLLCDVDREWHRSLCQCRHNVKGKGLCGRFFFKKRAGASPQRCPPHQLARNRKKQQRRNWKRKELSYYGA